MIITNFIVALNQHKYRAARRGGAVRKEKNRNTIFKLTHYQPSPPGPVGRVFVAAPA